MFKKLIAGELSLGATFWKFGVLGLLTINIVAKIFAVMLARKLMGMSVFEFFIRGFRQFNFDTPTAVLTVLYLSIMGFLLFYAASMVLGVWRASAKYEKSLWLRYLSRFIIIILAFTTFRYSF